MKQIFFIFFAVLFLFLQNSFAQIPVNTNIQILRAEDERRFDAVLENFLKSPNPAIRRRAALAAGRIGDEKAIPALALLLDDNSEEVKTMAAFALGETESAKAVAPIVGYLQRLGLPDGFNARLLEAAGKVAAANPKDAQTAELGKAIVTNLDAEYKRRGEPNTDVVLAGITAILRARPVGGEEMAMRFLDNRNPRIRADALNTLARLRSKTAVEKSRELLQKDTNPIVRANAARILAFGEEKSVVDALLSAATKDEDSRVRVSAIRSLGSFKDAKIANALLTRTQTLLALYKIGSSKRFEFPPAKNELLEISTTLGRLLAGSENKSAIDFLTQFDEADKYQSPEIQVAFAKIAPTKFSEFQRNKKDSLKSAWQAVNATMAGIGELANAKDSPEIISIKNQARSQAADYIRVQSAKNLAEDKTLSNALSAYAAYKPNDLSEILRDALNHRDPIVRATVAGLMAEQPASKENTEALKAAFSKSLLTDKRENDAQLAILDALAKLDKKSSVGNFLTALDAPDYPVRKKAFEILSDKELQKDFPGIASSLSRFAAQKKNLVLPYAPLAGTKLGQVLNSRADYLRAISRKNGSVRAVLTTTKGNFTIEFFPEDAPLTVDNFIKLARSKYFNGLEVHRVVPNFVMQDGDPRGDGSGGPGWSIRCEINMIPYERGAIGMALSGKDTGGSQWFATHSPQPHLDGGYTVFGKVNETDMKIVDSIVRGDKILSVRIIENTGGKR